MLHYSAGVIGDVKQNSTIRPGSIVDDVLYPEVHALTTMMLCIYIIYPHAGNGDFNFRGYKMLLQRSCFKYSNGII